MAHNIYFNEKSNQHSFFSVREKAWHGLGKIVQNYPTSAEAIRFAGLDYSVEKRKLFTCDQPTDTGNTSLIPNLEVPGYYSTVRADNSTVLGVVGKDYEIVQNTDAFSFFDAIVGGDGIQYETAGALGKGERIFITAKLPGYIKVGQTDLIERYLFLTTSHDGLGSITAAFTPVRIVCNNTLNAALQDCVNSIKIRHTAGAKEKLEQAHRIMGISNDMSEDLENLFNRWSRIRITDSELWKLIRRAMAPNKEALQNINDRRDEALSAYFNNMCDNVLEYALSNPSQQQETTKGTLFGAYNAVTGYFQNVRTYKNEEARLKSVLFGNGLNKTQAAFNLCMDFLN
jgi:phage/plasmid-like protein (TIGR03299 family)